MKYLAIDTASTSLKIVVVSGEKQYGYLQEDSLQASFVLLAEIEKLLAKANLGLADLDFLGVTIGPGSFTGIRIGVSTIRAFAYALNLPVRAVTLHEVLSYDIIAPASEGYFTVIDGGREVCYFAELDGSHKLVKEPICILKEEATKLANESKETLAVANCAVQGFVESNSGISSLKMAIENASEASYTLVEPLYVRRCQAEREAGEL